MMFISKSKLISLIDSFWLFNEIGYIINGLTKIEIKSPFYTQLKKKKRETIETNRKKKNSKFLQLKRIEQEEKPES